MTLRTGGAVLAAAASVTLAASLASSTWAAAQAAAAAPGAVPAAVDRVETPIASASPRKDVAVSVVRLKVPMPATAAPHPAACDWIAYQRFRSATGPTEAMSADAVAIWQPGVIEGATAFDPVARSVVREAKRRGRNVEVWAIDRRANCLEDHTGVDYLAFGGDYQTALKYYFGGGTINGKRFAGFKANLRVLADIGLAQTMNDYYAVMTRELPDQAWREKHLICGGHSMGGPLAETFASWDFDGNRATTTDAGYRQCAGVMGFDTQLRGRLTTIGTRPDLAPLNALTGGVLNTLHGVTVESVKSGRVSPQIQMLGIGPETMTALEALSVVADQHPDLEATPMLRAIPQEGPLKTFFHLQGSSSFLRWTTSQDSIRDNRYTNLALLGQIMDDNGGDFGLVRSSFGFFDGPVRPNNLTASTRFLPPLNILLADGELALPQPGALVGWRNYNDLQGAGAGYTSAGEEITDAHDYARIVHEGPLNFTENHFPVRMLLEFVLLTTGDRSGDLSHSIYYDAITKKPRMAVIAEHGQSTSRLPRVDPFVLAKGYDHVDTITAAEQQNDGKPEVSSQTVVDFIEKVVP